MYVQSCYLFYFFLYNCNPFSRLEGEQIEEVHHLLLRAYMETALYVQQPSTSSFQFTHHHKNHGNDDDDVIRFYRFFTKILFLSL